MIALRHPLLLLAAVPLLIWAWRVVYRWGIPASRPSSRLARATSHWLPVLLALARGTEEERVFWRRVLEDREQTEADLPRAQALMARHGALADTIGRARDYGDAALAALAGFPDGPERRAMAGIVEFCIARAR